MIYENEISGDWQPFRLVSLLDMLKKYAAEYYEIGKSLANLELVFDFVSNEKKALKKWHDPKFWVSSVKDLVIVGQVCADLKLKASASQTVRVIDKLKYWLEKDDSADNASRKRMVADLSNGLEILQGLLSAELEAVPLIPILREYVHYYEKNQFTEEVADKFPKAINDMKNAGKCYAVGLYTASAFHLLRVSEYGLQEIVKVYGLPPLKSWGGFLTDLRKYAYDSKKPREKEIMKLYAQVLAMKCLWRDDTMHAIIDYDPDGALEAFQAVKNFMTAMTKPLP